MNLKTKQQFFQQIITIVQDFKEMPDSKKAPILTFLAGELADINRKLNSTKTRNQILDEKILNSLQYYWQPLEDLLTIVEDCTLTKQRISLHLKKFIDNKLVEKKTGRDKRGNHHTYYRLFDKNTFDCIDD